MKVSGPCGIYGSGYDMLYGGQPHDIEPVIGQPPQYPLMILLMIQIMKGGDNKTVFRKVFVERKSSRYLL